MALDLRKMKSKQQNLNGGGFQWKPQDGENLIRIVPVPDGDPFKEVHLHYNIERGGVLCPKRNFGEECPACDYASSLFNSGDEESRKAAKDIVAKKRFYSPVIDRNDANGGVRWYAYSKTVYEKMLSLVLNPDYGDITDPESGTDLNITYSKGGKGTFPSTDVQPKRKSSILSKDEALLTEIAEKDYDIFNNFKRKSPEEIKELLDVYLLGDDNAEEGGDVSPANEKSLVDEVYQKLRKS